MAQDKKIRESYFKRDKDFNEKIRQQMEDEENMLKSYFKQYKKPTAQDPSIMKRQPSEQRATFVKSFFSPFRVFGLFYEEYWNKQCSTPEQRYVLKLCKEHTKKQIFKGILFSVTLTSIVSYQMRMLIGTKFHLMSLFVGVSSGFLYGVISSSQYTLQKFEALGDKYALGRATMNQISKFRMDKQM